MRDDSQVQAVSSTVPPLNSDAMLVVWAFIMPRRPSIHSAVVNAVRLIPIRKKLSGRARVRHKL